MNIKITTLSENTVAQAGKNLIGEHGLSFYIEGKESAFYIQRDGEITPDTLADDRRVVVVVITAREQLGRRVVLQQPEETGVSVVLHVGWQPLAGMGLTGSNREPGIMAAPPATIKTTMVSPMALDIPRITAVEIPEMDAGTVTRQIVSQWVAPKAKEASLSSFGTLNMASSEMLQIVGMDMNASITEALKRFRPVATLKASWRNGATTTIPKKPMTTEGRAARSSTIGFTHSRILAEDTSAR